MQPLALGLVRGPVGVGEVGGAQPLAGAGELYLVEVGELHPVVGEVDGEYLPDGLVPYPPEQGPDLVPDVGRGALVLIAS